MKAVPPKVVNLGRSCASTLCPFKRTEPAMALNLNLLPPCGSSYNRKSREPIRVNLESLMEHPFTLFTGTQGNHQDVTCLSYCEFDVIYSCIECSQELVPLYV